VCALHEQSNTLVKALIKLEKCKFYLRIAKGVADKFPESESLLIAGVTLRRLASRKLVWGDPYNEGSETAKSGTDEQEVHKRHEEKDKYAHQYDVRSQ
jgi:hypothetical protein